MDQINKHTVNKFFEPSHTITRDEYHLGIIQEKVNKITKEDALFLDTKGILYDKECVYSTGKEPVEWLFVGIEEFDSDTGKSLGYRKEWNRHVKYIHLWHRLSCVVDGNIVLEDKTCVPVATYARIYLAGFVEHEPSLRMIKDGDVILHIDDILERSDIYVPLKIK